MTFHLEPFAQSGLNEPLLRLLLAEHRARTLPRLERLWNYYHNAPECRGPGRPRLAQEAGLPTRFKGGDQTQDDRAASRREVVIENDIAWRIQAMVDFMFGKPVSIASTAADEPTRRLIERVLDAVWEASGGISLLQDLALLGHVYGHADLLLRTDDSEGDRALRAQSAPDHSKPPAPPDAPSTIDAAVRLCRVELIEPTRALALLSPGDYRRIDAYILHFDRDLPAVDLPGPWRTAASRVLGAPTPRRRRAPRTEIFSASARQLYDDGRLVESVDNPWTPGEVPVAHIQNISIPFRYEGAGEVEPLIPLQDELNTRLSDRAARVTMQSFKMYLAKGIDGFERVPVGPGQIVSTDNPDASIEAFGGDGHSPSEESHIQELREALDKASGIPPLASGVVRARIGNLSSANALRITLMGVLSKTARKRVTYGGGIARICRLILAALDAAGILRTSPADRGVRLVWPDPLPEDLHEATLAARAKADLGVDRRRVLAELGYADADPGIQ